MLISNNQSNFINKKEHFSLSHKTCNEVNPIVGGERMILFIYNLSFSLNVDSNLTPSFAKLRIPSPSFSEAIAS